MATKYRALKGDTSEEALGPGPGEKFRRKLQVGVGRGRPVDWTGGNSGFTSLLMPRSFITSMMTSVLDAPIWKPNLPPSTRIAAGAPEPAFSRLQIAYPRPNLA